MGGQIETAVGRERESVTGDFAIGLVGDARLDAIGQVLLGLVVDAGWNGDLQLAIGIERATLLGFLLAAIGVSVARPFFP